MSHKTSPDNVPSATKGTSDSVAAPGRVGVGGTKRIVIFLALFGLFVFVVWLAANHLELFLWALGVAFLALLVWSISDEIEKSV